VTARMTLRRKDGVVYLTRWGIESRRLGGVFIHRMDAPDPGRDLHTHPWNFWSVVLWGGYAEERINVSMAVARAQWADRLNRSRRAVPARRGPLRSRSPLSVSRLGLNEAHRIVSLNGQRSWSLVVHGPHQGPWHFATPDGWVESNEYKGTARGLQRGLEVA
jgi:hypothetical protein